MSYRLRSTADGEYLFPYMRVNETGDMAGKIALAMIYNLGEAE